VARFHAGKVFRWVFSCCGLRRLVGVAPLALANHQESLSLSQEAVPTLRALARLPRKGSSMNPREIYPATGREFSMIIPGGN
jgi:hypothetical protein